MAVYSLTLAQNSKVTSGVIAYDNGRFEESIEKLEEALSNKADLKEKNIPKAHIYLCRAYLGVASDSSLMAQYPDAVEKAYMHYEQTKETDPDGKYEAMLTLTEQSLWPSIFNAGAMAYNEEKYEDSRDYFIKAIALSPEDINSHIMLGYSNWMMRDSSAAVETLRGAIDAYDANPVEESKNDIARAYLMIATVSDGKGNSAEALEILSEAREKFPTDRDLQRTELSIYQKRPDLFEGAKTKFEEAIKADPDDNNLKLAYADLLDKNGDRERAMTLFQEVLDADPDNVNANIQIGASFINQAAEVNKKKMEMTKEADIDAANEEIRALMRKAEPYMKKLMKLEPNQVEWVSQMISIAYILEYSDEEIAELEKKASELRGN